jgi:threonine synthase
LLQQGAITPDQTTVLVLTGSGLKASEKIGQLLNLNARSA